MLHFGQGIYRASTPRNYRAARRRLRSLQPGEIVGGPGDYRRVGRLVARGPKGLSQTISIMAVDRAEEQALVCRKSPPSSRAWGPL